MNKQVAQHRWGYQNVKQTNGGDEENKTACHSNNISLGYNFFWGTVIGEVTEGSWSCLQFVLSIWWFCRWLNFRGRPRKKRKAQFPRKFFSKITLYTEIASPPNKMYQHFCLWKLFFFSLQVSSVQHCPNSVQIIWSGLLHCVPKNCINCSLYHHIAITFCFSTDFNWIWHTNRFKRVC